jgi:hypothetical protein
MLYGAPYPIEKNPLGLLYSQQGINQVKSDLLTLLLTNPGERVMLPQFGTALRSLIFEPNDDILATSARQMIVDSIRAWEPRIAIKSVDVTNKVNEDGIDVYNTLYIRIEFIDPGNIPNVQVLVLEVPLSA